MRYFVSGVAGLLLSGCVESPGDGDGDGESEARSGKAVYLENCAACHGPTGAGDGPASDGLAQSPSNLRLIAERAGGSFPADDVLAKIHGYTGPGHFGDMPEFGSEMDGAKVIWTTAEGDRIPTAAGLVRLVRYLESLQDAG